MNQTAAVTAAVVVTKVTLSTLQEEGFYSWSFLVYVFNMDLLQANVAPFKGFVFAAWRCKFRVVKIHRLLVSVDTHNGEWHSTMTF